MLGNSSRLWKWKQKSSETVVLMRTVSGNISKQRFHREAFVGHMTQPVWVQVHLGVRHQHLPPLMKRYESKTGINFGALFL